MSEFELEEVQFEAGVSEGTWTKAGQNCNFFIRKFYDKHSWNINGPYLVALGSGIDGLYVFPFKAEITALALTNGTAGASGTTEIDIHWYNTSEVDQGTIFSTRPSITSAAGDNSWVARNLVDGNSKTGTGLTAPVFSKTTFEQFEALRFDLDSAQSVGKNLSCTIYIRPIN